jgi:hypothetical protein
MGPTNRVLGGPRGVFPICGRVSQRPGGRAEMLWCAWLMPRSVVESEANINYRLFYVNNQWLIIAVSHHLDIAPSITDPTVNS